MTAAGNVNSGLWTFTAGAQGLFTWLLDGPKQILDDVDATSDFLKLVQRVNDVVSSIIQILPLRAFTDGVAAIAEFSNVRSIVSGLHDLISGTAAWEDPLSDKCPDFLKVTSKLAFLIGDITSVACWFSSLHILADWVQSSTAQIGSWGKKFNVAQGIGDVSCITGSLLSVADTVRLIVKKDLAGGENKRMKWSSLTDHLLDVAGDVSNIVASVLYNIPGVPVVLSALSLAIGSVISLGKFFKKVYLEQPELESRPIRSVDEPFRHSLVKEL